MSTAPTHVGYADESHWNKDRFRSLGLVTLSIEYLQSLTDEARHLLGESSVREFKWKNLDGAKERFAAKKLCTFAVEKACAQQLRVDVLIWDIEDSRHRIRKRDDIENLQRMYYHLFHNVMKKRWPNDAIWRLHPDEHTALDWETVQDCLEAKSTSVETNQFLFATGEFRLRLHREFGIKEVRPISSENHPLLQLADLFAGLAVFSYDKFDEYQGWLQGTSPQLFLWGTRESLSNPSRASQERFDVLQGFNETCKRKRLGVSLKKKRGLWTPNPQNPINFWMYEPQHPDDKAPQKGKR